jgi:hypothetical protein
MMAHGVNRGYKITGAMYQAAKLRWVESIKGAGNHMYGTKRPDDVRARISSKLKGVKKSDDHIRNARDGREYKPLSKSTKQKIIESIAIRKYITPFGEFFSSVEAGKACGCSSVTIINRCKNNKFSEYNYINL